MNLSATLIKSDCCEFCQRHLWRVLWIMPFRMDVGWFEVGDGTGKGSLASGKFL